MYLNRKIPAPFQNTPKKHPPAQQILSEPAPVAAAEKQREQMNHSSFSPLTALLLLDFLTKQKDG